MAEVSAWITIITPLLLPHRSSAELAESDEPTWKGYDWDTWDIETLPTKSPEMDDIAPRMHFYPFLYLTEASYLGHLGH
jgi:hypothetical protein